MTDIKDIKTKASDFSEKVKAIYPHITVTGDVDKPYYNIDWYDLEKKTMYRGYSSYDLKLVKKWLQEDFEVVEEDIDNLINRQQERIKTLTNSRDNWRRIAKEFDKASRETEKEVEGLQAEIERLNSCVKSEDEVRAIMKAQMEPMVKAITNEQIDLANKCGRISGILEFAERLKENTVTVKIGEQTCRVITVDGIDYYKKEMVGEV